MIGYQSNVQKLPTVVRICVGVSMCICDGSQVNLSVNGEGGSRPSSRFASGQGDFRDWRLGQRSLSVCTR